eukprot:RCo012270
MAVPVRPSSAFLKLFGGAAARPYPCPCPAPPPSSSTGKISSLVPPRTAHGSVGALPRSSTCGTVLPSDARLGPQLNVLGQQPSPLCALSSNRLAAHRCEQQLSPVPQTQPQPPQATRFPSPVCRRELLLHYFGEQRPLEQSACGQCCDVCA